VCLCAALPLAIEIIYAGKRSVVTVSLNAAVELVLGIALVILLDYVVSFLWRVARLPVDLIFATIWTISLFIGLRDKLRKLQLEADLRDTGDERESGSGRV
jgi:hypothetical protein